MLPFGVRIFLILIFIGGIVALIGDYIGHRIGRRRLTLFNLRPRYTAMLITITTGILIAVTTLMLLLAVSQDARTALFGMEKLRKELGDQSQQLNKTREELIILATDKEKTAKELAEIDKNLLSSKEQLLKAGQEIVTLKSAKEKLRKEVEISRTGDVLFKIGDALLVSVIMAGPEKAKLDKGLQKILSAADVYVRSYGIKNREHLIIVSPEEYNQILGALQKQSGQMVVKVVVTSNTLFGEAVPVKFELSANKLVYKADDIIAETDIKPALSIPELETEIKKLLVTSQQHAREAGVVPDPSGSLGSVSYAEISSLSKKINAHKRGALVKTLAAKDTYAIGPVEIKFRVFYQ